MGKTRNDKDIALLFLEERLDLRDPVVCTEGDPLCTIDLMAASAKPDISSTATGWGATAIEQLYVYSECFYSSAVLDTLLF